MVLSFFIQTPNLTKSLNLQEICQSIFLYIFNKIKIIKDTFDEPSQPTPPARPHPIKPFQGFKKSSFRGMFWESKIRLLTQIMYQLKQLDLYCLCSRISSGDKCEFTFGRMSYSNRPWIGILHTFGVVSSLSCSQLNVLFAILYESLDSRILTFSGS